MAGYIKIYRQMLKWEWYDDINTKCLFLHCLLRANYEPSKWRGINLKKGQFITSYQNLATECGLTARQVRTSLERLKTTNELTHETTNQYSIITINNWDKWQANDTRNDKQTTTDNNVKNDKNEKNMFNTVCINSENQEKKIDPFTNPLIRFFKDEYFKFFNNKPYLTAIERNKIFELNRDIENFKETIPVVLSKLKNVDFGFDNWKPTASWLLKDSNYTAVLNGTYDKQEKKSVWEELRERHNGTT